MEMLLLCGVKRSSSLSIFFRLGFFLPLTIEAITPATILEEVTFGRTRLEVNVGLVGSKDA